MSLSTLPAELLSDIAEYSDQPSHLAALILTCRSCHAALTSLLYRTIVLAENDTIRLFCRTLLEDETSIFADMIKYFTLGRPNSRPTERAKLLGLIAEVLTRLSHLEELDCFWNGTGPELYSALRNVAGTLRKASFTFIPAAGGRMVNHENIPTHSFPQLYDLTLTDYHARAHCGEFIRDIILSRSGQLRDLALYTAIPAHAAQYLSLGTWTSLENLSLTHYSSLTRDVIPRLDALKSLTIACNPRANDIHEDVVAAGRFTAQHLPQLQSISCDILILPLFFPVQSASMSPTCKRRVSSLTLDYSVWEHFHRPFAESVTHSGLAIHLKKIFIAVCGIDLDRLAELLAPLTNIEELKLSVNGEHTDGLPCLLGDKMLEFGFALLRAMPKLRTIIIYEPYFSRHSFAHAEDLELQHQWLTDWDDRHPNNTLQRVEFCAGWSWTKDMDAGIQGSGWGVTGPRGLVAETA